MTAEYHEGSTTQNQYSREGRAMLAAELSEQSGRCDRLALLLDDPPPVQETYTREQLEQAVITALQSNSTHATAPDTPTILRLLAARSMQARKLLGAMPAIQVGLCEDRLTRAMAEALKATCDEIQNELNPPAGPAPF